MGQVSRVSSEIEAQTEFAHQYWAAAAEDIASSSRDWAAVHSGVRTQAGMQAAGLPLNTSFN